MLTGTRVAVPLQLLAELQKQPGKVMTRDPHPVGVRVVAIQITGRARELAGGLSVRLAGLGHPSPDLRLAVFVLSHREVLPQGPHAPRPDISMTAKLLARESLGPCPRRRAPSVGSRSLRSGQARLPLDHQHMPGHD
jgi:hypothetical protein